jgi:GTP-binding protein
MPSKTSSNPEFEFSKKEIERGRKLCSQNCEFVLGVADLWQLPTGRMPEIAFAGRSNVGKSSLMNSVLGRKDLVRVSKTPGRTRELNFFNLADQLMLVDMPGYGYAKVSDDQKQKWDKVLLKYLRGRQQLKRVFVLIDTRRGLKDSDEQLMTLLDEGAVSYQILMTKADEVKGTETFDAIQNNEKLFENHAALHPHVMTTSAHEGQGIPELRALIARLALD